MGGEAPGSHARERSAGLVDDERHAGLRTTTFRPLRGSAPPRTRRHGRSHRRPRRVDGEYEQDVAIKILREGAASEALVQRFLRERQVLAGLDHPYIAKLLDGGTTTSGEPFLVMEYVEGVPADAFAASLPVRERLELFVRICEAVEHAHEREIVHRDLKPDNVLVREDGTPRLLDFGIARPDGDVGRPKDSAPMTLTGHRLFTPEYASPEQVRGETATAQSDVFALGVLLYVFLCGEGPWGELESLHALERAICDAEPLPPSRTLQGTGRDKLSRDLDAVTLQCLEKRPARRYSSATALREDVERYLAGDTVLARRVGTVERLARHVRRRPLIPVAATLTLAASIAAWVAWGAKVERNERGADLHIAVIDRLGTARSLWLEGDRDKAQRELRIALEDLEGLPPHPVLEAELFAQQAVFASMQGQYLESLRLIELGQAACDRASPPEPTTVTKLLSARTLVLQKTRPGPESAAAAREAVDYAIAHVTPGFTLRTDAMMHWATELRRSGALEDAEKVMRDAVEESRAFDAKGVPLARILNSLAVTTVYDGRYSEGIELYRESLEILEWHYGARNPSHAHVRMNYGAALFRSGELTLAREQYESALEAFRTRDNPKAIAGCQHFLGRIHTAEGDQVAAEALCARSDRAT